MTPSVAPFAAHAIRTRLQAPFWTALGQIDHADLCLTRRADADIERARELAQTAAACRQVQLRRTQQTRRSTPRRGLKRTHEPEQNARPITRAGRRQPPIAYVPIGDARTERKRRIAEWEHKACHLAGRNLTKGEWVEQFPGESYRKTCAEWPGGE
jgi:hypothetical protein